MKPKKPPKIARKLQDGEVLHMEWSPEGHRRYWLEPSHKNVTEPAAQKAIAWPNVQSLEDGLLSEFPQTWAWR